jgi:hypothetical protein
MSSTKSLKFFAAGALAFAAVSLPAFAVSANERAAAATELSAQGKEDPKNKKAAPQNGAPRQAPRNIAPRNIAPRQVQQQRVAPRVIERHVTPQGGGNQNLGVQKKFNAPNRVAPATASPRIINPNSGGPKTARRVFTPRGANSRVVSAARIRGVPMRGAGRTSIGGRNYSVWRSGYRLRHGGSWRTFVGLGTLGALMIGTAEYYPYAYIDAPADYCDGLTEDGCQLVYDEVETMEGDSVPQCVAYCPWQ